MPQRRNGYVYLKMADGKNQQTSSSVIPPLFISPRTVGEQGQVYFHQQGVIRIAGVPPPRDFWSQPSG